MLRKFTLLLPIDVFKDLQAEALRERISISDVIRDKILQAKNPKLENPIPAEKPKFEAFTKPDTPPNDQFKTVIPHIDFASLETLYLLREFLFDRNGQILKRVDDKMEKSFGKERKKFL